MNIAAFNFGNATGAALGGVVIHQELATQRRTGRHHHCLSWAGLVWFGLVWFGLVWFGTYVSEAQEVRGRSVGGG
ncbi:hypothetical protein [Vreelandella zhanjiangensis]|uniref:hypothetical protein n=1 Tax=Vreelandella zhanjiangensis TaxID=1121960 RepID=UPI00036A2873|nr:hypothetical protein [Halomonas zhanjiangensis]